jgi:hypothetical protein
MVAATPVEAAIHHDAQTYVGDDTPPDPIEGRPDYPDPRTRLRRSRTSSRRNRDNPRVGTIDVEVVTVDVKWTCRPMKENPRAELEQGFLDPVHQGLFNLTLHGGVSEVEEVEDDLPRRRAGRPPAEEAQALLVAGMSNALPPNAVLNHRQHAPARRLSEAPDASLDDDRDT